MCVCVCVVYVCMISKMLGTVKHLFLVQGGGKVFRE